MDGHSARISPYRPEDFLQPSADGVEVLQLALP